MYYYMNEKIMNLDKSMDVQRDGQTRKRINMDMPERRKVDRKENREREEGKKKQKKEGK